MTEGFFHSLVANLDCMPEDPRSNPCGKGKEVSLFFLARLVAQPGVDVALACIGRPVVPGGGTGLVVHCRSANRCPRSVEITLDHRSEGGWTLCQRRFCGKGYEESKMVRKVWGHMADGKFSSRWKWDATPDSGREATSASVFWTPATWKTAGGADRVWRCRMARPRSRRNEIGVSLRVAMRVVHATAGELSQPMANWAPTIALPIAVSRTAVWRSTPAISRSELVIWPVGFVLDTTEVVTSAGHWIRQTMGRRRCVPPNHTPPAPKALASQ
jgi:hypothetical protein